MGLFDGNTDWGSVAAGAGLGYLTGGYGGAFAGGMAGLQMSGAEQANAQNAEIALENRRWQERMANSAHVREVDDLKAAGLNPILSVNAGATTPQGATAQMQNTMEGMAQSGREIAMMKLNADKMKSETQLNQATVGKAQADVMKTGEEMNLLKAQQRKADMETKVMSKGVPEADLKNKGYNWIKSWMDKLDQQMKSGAIKFKSKVGPGVYNMENKK